MITMKHGGPAFPSSNQVAMGDMATAGHAGMTLRDYFAAKAMQGLMGRAWGDPKTGLAPANIHEIWAVSAYHLADAMLTERAK